MGQTAVVGVSAGAVNPQFGSKSKCFVKRDISNALSPPLTRGPFYLRYQHHSSRGPHFSMRVFLMRVPRFRALWPLLSRTHAERWLPNAGLARLSETELVRDHDDTSATSS